VENCGSVQRILFPTSIQGWFNYEPK